jgi:hypothetical protein
MSTMRNTAAATDAAQANSNPIMMRQVTVAAAQEAPADQNAIPAMTFSGHRKPVSSRSLLAKSIMPNRFAMT